MAQSFNNIRNDCVLLALLQIYEGQ